MWLHGVAVPVVVVSDLRLIEVGDLAVAFHDAAGYYFSSCAMCRQERVCTLFLMCLTLRTKVKVLKK
jgi:hypothetical protein